MELIRPDSVTATGRRAWLLVAICVAIAALAAGCTFFRQVDKLGNVQVQNTTDVPIDVVWLPPDGPPSRS